MRMSLKLACAVALVAMAEPAFAGHFLFSITGSGYLASGTLTTDDLSGQPNDFPCSGCASGPGFLVTGMTGTINGDAITGVAPIGSLAGNNNKLYATAPYLDWGDLGIQTATHIYNVFEAKYYTGQPGWFIVADNTPLFSSPVTFSLSAAPAPEPASWALLTGGFGLIGGALRRRRTAVSAAL
jgi:hypothetical protein